MVMTLNDAVCWLNRDPNAFYMKINLDNVLVDDGLGKGPDVSTSFNDFRKVILQKLITTTLTFFFKTTVHNTHMLHILENLRYDIIRYVTSFL